MMVDVGVVEADEANVRVGIQSTSLVDSKSLRKTLPLGFQYFN